MALTAAMKDELVRRLDDPDESDESKREIGIFLLTEAASVQTRPEVAQSVLDAPIGAPEGRREELIAQQPPVQAQDTDVFTGIGSVIGGGTQEARAQEELTGQAAFEGTKQRLVQVVDFLKRPFLDEEQQGDLADKRRQENASATVQLLEDASALGMPNADIYRSIGAGEFVPDVVVSMAPAMLARTITGRIALDSVVGGALIGSTADLDEDALLRTAAGTLGSGVLGVLIEVPGMARSMVAGDVTRAMRERFGNLHKLPNDPFFLSLSSKKSGIPLTAGEVTGSSRVLALEEEAQARAKIGGPAIAFVARREVSALKKYRKLLEVISPEKLTPGSIIASLDTVREQAVRAVKQRASQQWRDTLRPALQGVGARFTQRGAIEGGRGFIDTTSLRAELLDIARVANDPVVNDPARAAWALRQHAQILKSPDGKMTIGAYQNITSGLSQGAVAEGFYINPRALREAMATDLRTTKDLSTDLGVQKTITGLEKANADYAIAIAPAEEIDAVFINKLGLGDKGLSGEGLSKRFLSLPPSQKKLVFDTINKLDPNLSRHLSGLTFRNMVNKNTVLSRTTDFLSKKIEVLDLASLARSVSSQSAADLRIMMNTPGMDAEQKMLLTSAFDLLAKFKDTPNVLGTAGGSAVGKMRDILINVVSRDSGFVARLLAGELTPGALERWLYTTKGMTALLDLGRIGVRPAKGAALAGGIAAMQTLAELDGVNDAQREALEKEVRRRQSLRQIGQSGVF